MKICLHIFFLLISFSICAQELQPLPGQRPNRTGGRPPVNNVNVNSRGDTTGFQRRNDLADSITISYRYLDSVRRHSIDSSINDFDTYFPVPSSWHYLGNNGAAARPIIFTPFLKPGFDPGFHAFDVYKFTLAGTKIYRTTRPFSSLSYQLASGKEQMIMASHTQNPRPNINFGFDYRLVSSPGFFVTQNTNHNNYRIFGNYQGRRKRYAATIVMLGNHLRASENGGITDDSLLMDPNRKERFSIPVNLGSSSAYRPNPFVTKVQTGNTYKDFILHFRHSYDIGKRDSIAINDSTTEYLFYPKLRLQHSFTINKENHWFHDELADSTVYSNWYGITLALPRDTVDVREVWQIMTNDFSIIQYPDIKNTAQFFQAGVTLENISRVETPLGERFHNLVVHAEYSNRTRNRKWDLLLKGELYAQGFNNGDYKARAIISRFFGKRFGDVSLVFENVNRTPSYIFSSNSLFNLGNTREFSKENIISFGATSMNPFINLWVRNSLISNYAYFYDYYRTTQSSALINIFQAGAGKKFSVTKRINLYQEAVAQVVDQVSPIKVPLLFLRSRLAFEGVFFRNLNLSAGLEARYHTPYYADNYSPLVGKFTPQDTIKISNLPDIHAFVHFRIKTFSGFIRAENLNTTSFRNGFGFTNHNFAAPHYPTQGLIIRFGIRWWFVN